jgi:hypothetical protein
LNLYADAEWKQLTSLLGVTNLSFSEFATIDDDVNAVSTLSDKDIVCMVQNRASQEPMGSVESVDGITGTAMVSFSSALKATDDVESFLLQRGAPTNLIDSFALIKDWVMSERSKNSRQRCITDYFSEK